MNRVCVLKVNQPLTKGVTPFTSIYWAIGLCVGYLVSVFKPKILVYLTMVGLCLKSVYERPKSDGSLLSTSSPQHNLVFGISRHVRRMRSRSLPSLPSIIFIILALTVVARGFRITFVRLKTNCSY